MWGERKELYAARLTVCMPGEQLLGELGWNALSATTLHFSQCYISLGVHCQGDSLDDVPISSLDKAVIHKHMETLATYVCLQGPLPRLISPFSALLACYSDDFRILPLLLALTRASMCADYSFLKYDQALVAAAGVAAARSICNISPVWPDELAIRLGYDMIGISECFENILAVAKLDSKDHFSSTAVVAQSVEGGVIGSVVSSAGGLDSEANGKDKAGIKESSPRCSTALAASW